MKGLVFAVVFFIVSVFLSFAYHYDFDTPIVVLATLLGYLTGKVFEINQELRSLRDRLANDRDERNLTGQNTPHSTVQRFSTNNANSPAAGNGLDAQLVSTDSPVQSSIQPNPDNIRNQLSKEAIPDVSDWKTPATEDSKKDQTVANDPETIELPVDQVTAFIKNYFTGGNLFVRVGIIILFFGVSFLLKYVSEQGMLPIKYRLIGVSIVAIAALLAGWRLRHKKPAYALLIQSAGIGILYLVIYATYSLYDLIPTLPAFILLFLVSMLSAALAVLQDSKALAVLGLSGGFLAPILVSSGSNNHIGLFSYYAVLNLAIVTIAWFKAWRSLNLLGFAFTFIIGTTWGVLSYSASQFDSTEPFLILFFLFYVLIAVLFALRQPPDLRGYVDGSLVFGVPLAASTLQYSLVKDYEYGVSCSAFLMGAFYLLLAWLIWQRAGSQLKLLAETFLVLGIIFTAIAIPFALDDPQTIATWGIEGLGMIWLGSRQDRLSVRIFGLILQLGAGLIFVFSNTQSFNATAFTNAEFISALMLTSSGILSARILDKAFTGRKRWEKTVSPLLLSWGLLWLFGGFAYQIEIHFGHQWLPTSLLLLTTFCSLGFTLAAQRLKPQWNHAWIAASGLFAIMLLTSFAQLVTLNETTSYHPFVLNGWLAWPMAFAVAYYLLSRLQHHHILQTFQSLFHNISLILLVVLITLEGAWQLDTIVSFANDWVLCWWIIPATLALWLIITAHFWPFSTHQEIYQQQAGVILSLFLLAWGLKTLTLAGNPIPIPWIPLLNPLDISLCLILLTLVKWWQTIRDVFTFTDSTTNQQSTEFENNQYQLLIISVVGLILLWLNFTLFRIAHHWFEVPYTTTSMYNTSSVQTAVSILWTLSGVLLTVYAYREQTRNLWIAGAVLLGLAVLKLFLIDLSELGSLARIISFLVVGILLTSIGYFAPLPDKNDDEVITAEDGNKHRQDI